MKKLSVPVLLAGCAAVLLLAAVPASAVTLVNTTGTFPATGTSTQVGRLSRNGVPQDFSGSEPFPGSNNPTITFNYTVFTLSPAALAGLPDVQIELDTQGLGLFVSAYANSYNPPSAANPAGSFQTNWLGDQGSSGDYSFGNTPNGTPNISFFGVTVPAGSSLVVVLATSGAAAGSTGTGAGTAYGLRIEGFSNVAYSAVPEPSSPLVMGAGLLGVGVMLRRRSVKMVRP